MRKAAVISIDEGAEVVEDRHGDEALRDQIIHGGEMTKSTSRCSGRAMTGSVIEAGACARELRSSVTSVFIASLVS
jgi:hypothetical protein